MRPFTPTYPRYSLIFPFFFRQGKRKGNGNQNTIYLVFRKIFPRYSKKLFLSFCKEKFSFQFSLLPRKRRREKARKNCPFSGKEKFSFLLQGKIFVSIFLASKEKKQGKKQGKKARKKSREHFQQGMHQNSSFFTPFRERYTTT